MSQCWREWNAKLHNREVGTPVVIAVTILENISLFDHGHKPGCWRTNCPLGIFRSSSWCPPPPGWIKVNVDGSLPPSGSAGLGVVVRSKAGLVLTAASFAWNRWDLGRVDLEAILAICRVVLPTTPEARGFIIEGDAANVLDFCCRASSGSAHPNTYLGAVDLSFLYDFVAVRFQ
ncbi:hypothetical protein KSP40_PGU009790 [Platanthera guangdongensis]|uniref:RNase H type-1 domain-containing protein n=1 Tax=Platanthera guangdongensis TaxID=2320717 RepID=A0ABR2LZR4_9ASPA